MFTSADIRTVIVYASSIAMTSQRIQAFVIICKKKIKKQKYSKKIAILRATEGVKSHSRIQRGTELDCVQKGETGGHTQKIKSKLAYR